MFPAALAIVVNNFPLHERGKALALFFGIAGGPHGDRAGAGWLPHPVDVAGHLLGQHPRGPDRPGPDRPVEAQDRVPAWPDRLPRRRPAGRRRRAEHLRPAAVGLVGLEQRRDLGLHRGWSIDNRLLRLLELRTDSPLIAVGIFRIRPFAVENVVLLIAMMAFVPMFFFASEYAQISLHKKASETGIILLFFFIGFVVAAQVGGRILDREGAKRAVVMGAAIAAVGFGLWASKVTTLSFPQATMVRRHRRGGHGHVARAGQHRRRKPGVEPVIR